MSELLTGSCPNCGSKLSYDPNESTVTCFACDSTVRIGEIAGSKAQAAIGAPSAFAMFTGFDNPESGVVFLENKFETYDWEAYQQLPDLEIPEINEVIANNQVKNGAVPETWYLDFKGLFVPVSKKFEGLQKLEEEIVEKFNPIDPTEIFAAFDTYKLVGAALLEAKDDIVKYLESAVKFAERFALKADRLKEIKADLATIEAKFAALATKTVTTTVGKAKEVVKKTVIVDKIEELPAYKKAKDAYAAKVAGEFTAKGINAKEVYENAAKAYEAGDVSTALRLFESIRAYSDSALYIDKMSQYFDFYGEVYRFGGRHFIYKEEDYTKEALNLKKLTKKMKAQRAEAGEADISALSLYEIVNGIPAEESTVKGIEQVITCYGTKLFYFKTRKGIACYDLATGTETMIDTGSEDLYKNENGEFECGFAKHAPIFYVRKKFREDIKGCLGKKKGTKENELNPYTLLLIDMSTNSCRVAVTEMVEIKLRKDDKIFYSFAYKAEKAKGFLGCFGKKKDEKPKSKLMCCDLEKGTTQEVLNDDCDICAVTGDIVLYTLWKNNDLNEDLHAYNMATAEDILIEKNIYEFFDLIEDKVYYTIGNAQFRPLVRANLDGSEREQVMLNVKKVEMIRGGWFYVTKGAGVNAVLTKIRVDGKDAKVLCHGIKKVVRFDGNYIYYTTVYGDLRVVRVDGIGDKLVVQDVDTIFPAEDGLYYCREELVDDGEEALSLYHMDKDGKGIRKIVFNVDRVQNDPISNTIYYSKKDLTRFKVFKPGKEDKAHYEFLTITKFYAMKKAEAGQPAGEPQLYLTLGLPEHEKKKGCLAKFKKDNVYVEAPIVHSYKTRGLSDVQIMAEEEEDIPVGAPAAGIMPAFLKGNKGCAGGKKKGCLAGLKPQKKAKGCGAKGCSPKKA